jgi:hypothetical protein
MSNAAKSASASFNPQHQNLESLNRVVGRILNMAGCDHCGRVALLRVDFLSDPPPELSKDGVISLQATGF